VCLTIPWSWNDRLIRSVDTHRPTAPKTELIVVQNSQKQFSTAGAALNHGVSPSHNSPTTKCAYSSIKTSIYIHLSD